jgi:hypothetical protein
MDSFAKKLKRLFYAFPRKSQEIENFSFSEIHGIASKLFINKLGNIPSENVIQGNFSMNRRHVIKRRRRRHVIYICNKYFELGDTVGCKSI